MSIITLRAKDRCEHKSMQEQLEDCRRQMQRDSGKDDTKTIDTHLNHDNWQTRLVLKIDGAD